MAIPHTRQDLLIATRTRYDDLWTLINALPATSKTKTFGFKGRDRNLRDVLIHLTTWQELYLNWSQTNLAGEQQVRFLPKPYTWATCGRLSRKLQQDNQTVKLGTAIKRWQESHTQMIRQIENLTQEQLFVPDFFSWTGTRALGDYTTLFSATRYAWALKTLRHFRHELHAGHAPVLQ
ncbi:MAG: ClbS/DfsB family four-helix bundle protein [Lactobacillus sp.]|jgi:hypothetical protein|nr:ClbS/DfsB family four-helix bundle protein [Lactobacillus sp.]MCI2032991.1 ClbS/DfsB family four-helix bundle protein [Lactobacillus sp.]